MVNIISVVSALKKKNSQMSVKEPYEQQNEYEPDDVIELMTLSIGLLVFLLLLMLALWVIALILLIVYWRRIEQWAKIVGVLGITLLGFSPFGTILTIIVVLVSNCRTALASKPSLSTNFMFEF